MPRRVEAESSVKAPKGYFVVYVGTKMTRYIVPTCFLRNAIFQELLENAANEYGYDNKEKIVLPCDEYTFNGIVDALSKRS
ncbi:Indole-3-acetic acid-induced protein ARG7 [Bienertia sinuspersici]